MKEKEEERLKNLKQIDNEIFKQNIRISCRN